MIKIFQESPTDIVEVEELLDLTFGPGRKALSSYRFRDGVNSVSELCLIMRDEFHVLVGVIRFWPVLIGLQRSSGLLLGPLSIHPTRQGEGLGDILITTSLKKAKEKGWLRVVLVGDLAYFSRFGFSKNTVKSIYLRDNNQDERLLGNELAVGSMFNLSGPLFKFSE